MALIGSICEPKQLQHIITGLRMFKGMRPFMKPSATDHSESVSVLAEQNDAEGDLQPSGDQQHETGNQHVQPA